LAAGVAVMLVLDTGKRGMFQKTLRGRDSFLPLA